MKKFSKVFAVVLVGVMAAALLCACAPNSDPDKALSALQDNGYTAAKDANVIPAALKLLGVSGVDCVVSGTKTVTENDETKTEHVTIVYFSSSDAAKEAFETLEDYASGKDSDSSDSDWSINRSGKMIYYGTSAGIKAAR